MKKLALAVLAALALASAALAQNPPFPASLGAKTVVGNMAPIAAPAGAVSLATLSANLLAGETPIADASYSQVLADKIIVYNTLTATRTVTLLPAADFAGGTKIYIMDRSGLASSTKTILAAPTGADTINGVNGSAIAISAPYTLATLESDGTSKWTISTSLPTSLTSFPLFTPAQFGAKCDGSTDDTNALQVMWSTMITAQGGTIEFPAGATCLVYNSGQSIATPLFQLSPGGATFGGVRVHGNGATIKVGHTFLASESFVVFNVVQTGNVWIDGLNLTQTTPTDLTQASPLGSVFLESINNSGLTANNSFNVSVTNATITGSQALYEGSNSQNIYFGNNQVNSTYYGVVGLDGVTGLFVNNLKTNITNRDLFLKGVTNWFADITSVNAKANTVLLSADANNAVLSDGYLNYHVLTRTVAGTPASYVTIGDTAACACTGAVYRNMRFDLNIDVSGDTSTVPVVEFIKGTTSSLSTVFENLKFSGRITGALNSSGKLFDLFTSGDGPWSGETAKNISFENVLVTGSNTPTFYVDYAPFPTSPTGMLSLRNFVLPGNYTDANNTNINLQRFALNASFSNGPIPSSFNSQVIVTGNAPGLTSGQGGLGGTATNGLQLQGNGSTSDITLLNQSGTTVCSILAGTTTWDCAGKIGLGIGTSAPGGILHVNNSSSSSTTPSSSNSIYLVTDGTVALNQIECYNNAPCAPEFWGRAAKGTAASPATTGNNQSTFLLVSQGYDANPNWGSGLGVIGFNASEAFSAGHNGQLFLVKTVKNATTTSSQTLTLDGFGHFSILGPSSAVPTITTCGTSPSAATGSDTAGQVTTGTGAVATCTITFANAYATAPFCTITDQNGSALTYNISTTAINVTAGSGTSHKLNWVCFGT